MRRRRSRRRKDARRAPGPVAAAARAFGYPGDLPATPPAILFAAAAVLFAAAAAWFVLPCSIQLFPVPLSFPEYRHLTAADPALWQEVEQHYDCGKGFTPDLAERLAAAGTAGESALIAHLLTQSISFVLLSAPPSADGEHAEAVWLREHAGAESRRLLARIAADGRVPQHVRLTAVIALCDPRGREEAGPLLEVAADPGAPIGLRQAIVERLARLGGRAPPVLGEVLTFGPRELSVSAAAALAAFGEAPLPSLLTEPLRSPSCREDQVVFVAQAAAVLAADSAAVRAAAADAVRWHGRGPPEPTTFGRWDEARDRSRAALADALGAWFAARPGSGDMPLEREHREYLDGPVRAREKRCGSLGDLLALPEGDLDLAAAILVAEGLPEGERDVALASFDRLCRAISREIGDASDSERILTVLSRRLLSEPAYRPYSGRFADVLLTGEGNCLSRTALLIAVSRRLSLPVCAVAAPGHVFARFTGGGRRRNIEPTEGGTEIPDRTYAETRGPWAASPEALAGGTYLRDLSGREFLGEVLANRVSVGVVEVCGDPDPAALAEADAAVALAPGAPLAWLARGLARLPVDLPGARADFERALAVDPAGPAARAAREAFENVEPLPEGREYRELRTLRAIVCYWRGEYERAEREAGEAAGRFGNLTVQKVRARAGRPLPSGVPVESPEQALDLAAVLLESSLAHRPDRAAARRILSPWSFLLDETVAQPGPFPHEDWYALRRVPGLRERFAALWAEADREEASPPR